jgi:hypothetical protein
VVHVQNNMGTGTGKGGNVGQAGPAEGGGGVTGLGEKRRVEEEERGGQALICKLSVSNYL